MVGAAPRPAGATVSKFEQLSSSAAADAADKRKKLLGLKKSLSSGLK